MPNITFEPSGKSIAVENGTGLADACRLAGFDIPTPCGGKGICGKCRVRLVSGDIDIDERQRACLSEELLAEDWRVSCIARVEGDLVLADPRTDGQDVILAESRARECDSPTGIWRVDLTLPPPDRNDRKSDLDRFLDALEASDAVSEKIAPSMLWLEQLPTLLRKHDFAVRVSGVGGRLLSIRGIGDETPSLGLAVDLGTTTIAAALCDLDTGEVLSVASRANPQARVGDDVISRIEHAAANVAHQAELRWLAVSTIQMLAEKTLEAAGRRFDDILLLAVGGNTVMNHLLLGVEPKPLAESPFISCFREIPPLYAHEIGWADTRPPLVMLVPNIAAYLGGDVTAGVLAHEVTDAEGNVLFLDVGTNGEIVLTSGGRSWACAAAAGPAFEGARISQGMRARPGAISRVSLTADGDIEIGIMGDSRPVRGICGTGLLDAVSCLLAAGVVDESGRMLDAGEAEKAGVPPAVLHRMHYSGVDPAIWLEMPGGVESPGVALTQRDIREFQLAKGAISAGVRVLLSEAGIEAADLDLVLLAGGFGSFLSPRSAMAVGLLPEGVDVGRVRSVGNAGLAGTRLYMLSSEERARAAEIIHEIQSMELSSRDDFQEAFVEGMQFPVPSAFDEPPPAGS